MTAGHFVRTHADFAWQVGRGRDVLVRVAFLTRDIQRRADTTRSEHQLQLEGVSPVVLHSGELSAINCTRTNMLHSPRYRERLDEKHSTRTAVRPPQLRNTG